MRGWATIADPRKLVDDVCVVSWSSWKTRKGGKVIELHALVVLVIHGSCVPFILSLHSPGAGVIQAALQTADNILVYLSIAPVVVVSEWLLCCGDSTSGNVAAAVSA